MELTHPQAVNRLKDIKDELERLDGKETLTAEDEAYWDELVRESAEVEAHAKALVRKAEKQRVSVAAGVSPRSGLKVERGSDGGELDRDIMDPDSVEDRKFRNPWDLSEIRTFNRSAGQIGEELRARAFSAIEQMPGMNTRTREGATKIVEEFDNEKGDIARMCLATSTPAYVRAFAKAARGQQHTFTQDEQDAVTRAMSLTDSAGGFLVPFQLDPTVIITSAGSRNDVRMAARQVVATGDIWNGVSSTAVSWSWDAEAAEVSDDTTTFAGPPIPVYKAAGFVPISLEALADEANVAQEVGRLLLFGKDTLESTAFVTGSGSGQPTGIITALTGGASVVTSTTTDVYAIADVYKTQGALPARYRRDASWLANNLVYNLTRAFDTGGGGGFWTNLQTDRPAQLMGRNALEAEAMDGVINAIADNLILLFGDFENYVIADRIGVTVEFIPQLFHVTTNRPSGSRGWYAYFRAGADSVNDDAFRLLNVT